MSVNGVDSFLDLVAQATAQELREKEAAKVLQHQGGEISAPENPHYEENRSASRFYQPQ